MIPEPRMKKEVAVSFSSKENYLIQFFGTADAANDFSRFGFVVDYGSNEYGLHVDRRYDFDEVLAYIQNYGGKDEK